MTTPRIIVPTGRTTTVINVANIEDMYSATFVGDFSIKTKIGWTNFPIAVFYQPNPKIELGHSYYFGMYIDDYGRLMITNAESTFSQPIVGITADDGQIIFSRFRHDFVRSNDGSVSIDGGREYTKYTGDPSQLVNIVIDKHLLVVSQ